MPHESSLPRRIVTSSSSELGTVGRLLLGCQQQLRVGLKALDIADHAGILDSWRDSHLPVLDRLLSRDTAELHQRRGGYRTGGMDAVPAVNKHRLTFGLDRVVNLLMNDRTPLSLPSFEAVIKVALRAVDYRWTMEAGAIEIVGGSHARIAERLELTLVKWGTPIVRTAAVERSRHHFAVVANPMEGYARFHDAALCQCGAALHRAGDEHEHQQSPYHLP